MTQMAMSDRDEWLARRRELITATDIPAILGISPWRSEGDVARDKRGELADEPSIPMRVGQALEPLIAELYAERTGAAVERWGDLVVHPELPWAGATPDYRAGDVIVECKWSASPRRWTDGLPEDYEAQVRWQLGVTGYRAADVAALLGHDLRVYRVEHDEGLWADLVRVADDFRRRLAAGGPFAETVASVARAYPVDSGAEMDADDELERLVAALRDVREQRERIEASEAEIEARIKARMGPAAVLRGRGWQITWRTTRESQVTDWRAVATTLLGRLPTDERAALITTHTTTKPGVRRFVLRSKEESDDD
jgi:putative phage-type endonuclease